MAMPRTPRRSPCTSIPITMELTSPSGLRATFDERGTLLGLMCGDIAVNLFPGNPLDGGPTQLVLRRHADAVESTPLLGPHSATRWRLDAHHPMIEGAGEWRGLRYRVAFRLAAAAPAWFWHVAVENASARRCASICSTCRTSRSRRMRPCG